jgi:hypothetical protein
VVLSHEVAPREFSTKSRPAAGFSAPGRNGSSTGAQLVGYFPYPLTPNRFFILQPATSGDGDENPIFPWFLGVSSPPVIL